MNISVIIPTYNRYEMLKRAILSVLAQTHQVQEIIIIDDGSSDETSQITKLFSNIKYFYQENEGVSSARNLGIKKAKYEWIAFLDSDDEWHTDKLAKQVEFHKKNPNRLMSYTDELWIRDNREVKIPKKYQKYSGEIFEKCLSHCIIAPSSSFIHKKIFDKVGLFDKSLEVCEDYDLWLRIASKYKIGLIDEKLIIKYAGHDEQLSFKYWGMDRFRVISLEKLLKSEAKATPPKKLEDMGCTTLVVHKQQIKAQLIKKYKLLLKGAIKHDKIQDIKYYEKRLRELDESN